MDPDLLHERVDDEWSFIETLRHLVFATDAWVSRAILGQPSPWDPLGLPHDEMPDEVDVPRDRAARPSLDQVLALRADRMATVRGVIAGLTDATLAGMTEPVTEPGYPGPESFRCAAACRRSSPRSGSTACSPNATSTCSSRGEHPSPAQCSKSAVTHAFDRKRIVAQCVTCGSELHPERAEKYDYCMAPECQEKNLKSLTMVAVGVNKSAEQYLLLDDETRDELARGKYRDQRRGSFGTSVASPASASAPSPAGSPAPATAPVPPPRRARPAQPRRPEPRPAQSRPAPRRPWSKSQEKLALLYNEQGRRPEEIAQKLGLSTYLVTQIILSSTNRGKL